MSQMQNIQWFPGHMKKTERQITACLPLIDAVAERCKNTAKQPQPVFGQAARRKAETAAYEQVRYCRQSGDR